MRLEHQSTVDASASEVVALLGDSAAWASWVPGVTRSQPLPQAREVELEWESVRPIQLTLSLVPRDDGLDLALIQGAVGDVHGSIRVREQEQGGCLVRWSLLIELVDPLPGPLAQEVQAHMLPRWHAALVRQLKLGKTTEPPDA